MSFSLTMSRSFAVQLDFGAAVFGDEDGVALLHGELRWPCLLRPCRRCRARSLRLPAVFPWRCRKNDATGALFLGLEALDEHALAHGFDFLCHRSVLRIIRGCCFWGGRGVMRIQGVRLWRAVPTGNRGSIVLPNQKLARSRAAFSWISPLSAEGSREKDFLSSTTSKSASTTLALALFWFGRGGTVRGFVRREPPAEIRRPRRRTGWPWRRVPEVPRCALSCVVEIVLVRWLERFNWTSATEVDQSASSGRRSPCRRVRPGLFPPGRRGFRRGF